LQVWELFKTNLFRIISACEAVNSSRFIPPTD
jgi:hypothetical protein